MPFPTKEPKELREMWWFCWARQYPQRKLPQTRRHTRAHGQGGQGVCPARVVILRYQIGGKGKKLFIKIAQK